MSATSSTLVDSTPPSVHNEAGNIMESPVHVQATNHDELYGYLCTFSELLQKLKERNLQLKIKLAATKEQLKDISKDNSQLTIQSAEITDNLKDENQQLKDKV
jgi:predicted nuclease with TOPRIM domain